MHGNGYSKDVQVNNNLRIDHRFIVAPIAAIILLFACQSYAHEPYEMGRMRQSIDLLTKQLADANTKIRRLEASMSKGRGRGSVSVVTSCDVGDARTNIAMAKGNRGKGDALETWLRAYGKSCSPRDLTQLKMLASELFYDTPSLELIDLFSSAR